MKDTGTNATVHNVKACGGIEVQLPEFLSLALNGGECQLHVTVHLSQETQAPVTTTQKDG